MSDSVTPIPARQWFPKGRPRKDGTNQLFKIRNDITARLIDAAVRRGVTKTSLVEEALDAYLPPESSEPFHWDLLD